jgi:succinyl-CoA synthetase beta subunit
MKLFEFQGKRVFKQYGMPIPSGKIIYPDSDLSELSPPIVLKSQVLTGGRGKAGGIKLWDGKHDIKSVIKQLFDLKINNEKVQVILAEEVVNIKKELYLAITFNKSSSTQVLIVGTAGGMDIEKSAQMDTNQVLFIEFNPLLGISDFQIRLAAKHLKIENHSEIRKIVLSMYRIFKELDAVLVEINPLALTSQGLIAVDSKIELDSQAIFRHTDLYQQLKKENACIIGSDYKTKSYEDTITYVPLSGNIGLVSDGAGTGLLTMDLLSKQGGRVASFAELGGITSPEVVHKALQKVNNDPNVKSILVVLIGGFNRMDDMAEGIVRFQKENKNKIPMFIRMCGTKEEDGIKIMEDAQIPIDKSLHEAVNKAINRAMEN